MFGTSGPNQATTFCSHSARSMSEVVMEITSRFEVLERFAAFLFLYLLQITKERAPSMWLTKEPSMLCLWHYVNKVQLCLMDNFCVVLQYHYVIDYSLNLE